MKLFLALLTRSTAAVLTIAPLLFCSPQVAAAQQSPPPFSVAFDFGRAFIGASDVEPGLQPAIGLDYIPDQFGIGLTAGFLSHGPAFDAARYTDGLEALTSISSSGDTWSSFFVGIGPRAEFGSSLPVSFRGSLDLAFTYASPPEMAVHFDGGAGPSGEFPMVLSEYGPGENYRAWSAALLPELQLQYHPGGSDRFALTVSVGLQHRLTGNAFTYTQKDLSGIRPVEDPEKMLYQFRAAPDVQKTESSPQTNFFSAVGFEIRFGNAPAARPGGMMRTASTAGPSCGCACGMNHPASMQRASETGDYNSSRSNRPPTVRDDTSTDCDDADDCVRPEMRDSETGDYNASRSNKPRSIRGGPDADADCDGLDDCIQPETKPSDAGDCDDADDCLRPDTKASQATDYNSSRSNTEGIISDGPDAPSDSTAGAMSSTPNDEDR